MSASQTNPAHRAMPANDDGIPADRRWALRRGIELVADLTDTAGLSYAARVTDLSEEGCMIRTLSGQDLARDSLHEIKITGLEAMSAYVVWAADGKAGLTFSSPLQPATVQNLVMKSLYSKLSQRMVRDAQSDEGLAPRGPFPFDD